MTAHAWCRWLWGALYRHPSSAHPPAPAQVILGMVSNPLGDVAPKGVAPPNLMPRHEPPPHGQPGPGPMGGPPPDMGMQPPHGMEPPHMQRGPPMQGPPMGMQGPPPPMGMQGPPPPMQPQPGMQPQQPYMQGPPPMEQPGFQQPGYMPPQQQQPFGSEPMLPPQAQPGGAGYGPAQPVDPRRMAGVGAPPRPMMPLAAQPPQQPAMPPMQQPGPAPPAAMPAVGAAPGGLTPEQQQGEGQLQGGKGAIREAVLQNLHAQACPLFYQALCDGSCVSNIPLLLPPMPAALLNQVMSLTPQQIELLPPQQKAQVLALQQQLRAQQ